MCVQPLVLLSCALSSAQSSCDFDLSGPRIVRAPIEKEKAK